MNTAVDIDLTVSPPKETIHIPAPIRTAILPSETGSISLLLCFDRLPTPYTIPVPIQDITEWFSDHPPDPSFHPAQLVDVPLPPIDYIRRLRGVLSQPLVSLQSIRPRHLDGVPSAPSHLPSWIVVYWENMHRVLDHHRTWAKTIQWVENHARGSANGRLLQKEILTNFASLQWASNLHGEVGYGSVLMLSAFLMNARLSSGHIAQMLSVLHHQLLLRSQLLSPHLVMGVELTDAIHSASIGLSGSPNGLLKQVESDLVSGGMESVGGVAFINNNHFTAYVLDLKTGYLAYGDSMGNPIPTELLKAFRWWICRLRGLGVSVGSLEATLHGNDEIRELPVTLQRPDDDWSCGVLAVNALQHHFLGTPLLGYTRSAVALSRLRHFRDITKSHLNSVPIPTTADLATFAVEAHRAEFTFRAPCSENNKNPICSGSSSPAPSIGPGSGAVSALSADSLDIEDIELMATSSDEDLALTLKDICVGKRNRELLSDESLSESSAQNVKQDAPVQPSPRKVRRLMSPFRPSSISQPSKLQATSSKSSPSLVPKSEIDNKKSITAAVTSGIKKTSQGIKAFFLPISTEEQRERERRQAVADAERRREVLEAAERAEQRHKKELREKAAERQRQCRDRRVADDIAAGKRHPNGRLVKIQKLKQFDDASTNQPAVSVAEGSRPLRALRSVIDGKDPDEKRGRPRANHIPKPAKYVNWFQPGLWAQIEAACMKVGRPWQPTKIEQKLKEWDSITFKQFRYQRISDWRDRTVTDRLVWKEHVQKAITTGNRPGGRVTRQGILADRPQLVSAIIEMLREMRDASIPLDLVTCCGLMIAMIDHYAPELFKPNTHGFTFKCSDSFTRRFLKRNLKWSLRKVTRAGQKVLLNAQELSYKTCLRAAIAIRDETIDAVFFVNTDQTQVVYSSGGQLTYHDRGAKQVQGEGSEEKRAFTLVVGVSASGKVLPFQAIYQGVDSKRSLPKKNAPLMDRAIELGFSFEVSGTSTYWSNQETMRTYVSNILAPYFTKHKERLNLPDQRCLWYIDVWSVHRSLEFREWMGKSYLWIILNYVPGGCTGLMQPCDVGIQRPLKHAIKRAAHMHTVNETLAALNKGTPPKDIRLDRGIRTLRDRSAEWIVRGYEAVNNTALSFESCTDGHFNLSHTSLTSRDMCQKLKELVNSDPKLYAEVSGEVNSKSVPDPNATCAEDLPPVEEQRLRGDDSSLSIKKLRKRAARKVDVADVSDSENDEGVDGYQGLMELGGVVVNADTGEAVLPVLQGNDIPAPTRPQRARVANRLYNNADWVNNDESSSDE